MSKSEQKLPIFPQNVPSLNYNLCEIIKQIYSFDNLLEHIVFYWFGTLVVGFFNFTAKKVCSGAYTVYK